MSHKFNLLKIMLLLAAVVGLYSFAHIRNNVREVQDIKINFIGENNLFITQSSVSKLLIQNQGGLTDKPKRIIDLNQLENTLKSNPLIKNAEVSMSLDAVISAKIEQKKPLARVIGDGYYIDDTGSWMPLSDNYTARVPLVTGNVEKQNLESIYSLASYIKSDEFLKQSITEIHQESQNSFKLRLRQSDILVEFGDVVLIEKKFNNLKAFLQKAAKDEVLGDYEKINLRFSSQVICTKK